jgi:dTDP-glucose 4,6-dehydratase
MRILVTGGAGFIGSAFIRLALPATDAEILNLDKLTYAGNPDNLAPVAENDRYRFVQGDISDPDVVQAVFEAFRPDVVVHFAAESHVDRSILTPEPVIRTNLNGTFTLLEAARRNSVKRFVHVSTDEVYGSLEHPLEADETFPLRTSSPYSASKAGSDLLALSYHTTYRLPVIVTRASNNYGPYQFPEKLIPLFISNCLHDEPLPVYGTGGNVRDWIHVLDHCRGIDAALRRGRPGEVYNFGGDAELTNLELTHLMLELLGKPRDLIRFVQDRPGHDLRYAIDFSKAQQELGWQPRTTFRNGLQETIDWYLQNTEWTDRVRSGEYRTYYESQYGTRLDS